MAFARDSYTASGGSQTDFTVTFPYIAETHIVVTKNGTTMTNQSTADTISYQIVSSTTVRFGAGLTDGDVVVITRSTSQSSRLVDYAADSTLTETDLDNDSLQAFYFSQESFDRAALSLGLDLTDEQWDGESKRIKSVATPTVSTDAVNKAYADAIAAAAGNVPAAGDPGENDYALVATSGSGLWKVLPVAGGGTGAITAAAARTALGSIATVVEDTTPQLGGDLDLNGKNIDFPTTSDISDCLDEDTMSSDSATMLATQQSIKAYVDTNAKDLEFVSTAAITAVTAITVTSLAAGYDYIITLEAFSITDDIEVLWMRFSDDGSTYEAGAADYGWGAVSYTTGARDDSDAQIALTGSSVVGNDAGTFNTMEITLHNPNASSENTMATWNGIIQNGTPQSITIIGGGEFQQGTDPVLAVQFLWAGGSTFKAQGDITVWRRKRS